MLELGSRTLIDEPFLAELDEDERVGQHGLCTAELAECSCPDFCERDHDTD